MSWPPRYQPNTPAVQPQAPQIPVPGRAPSGSMVMTASGIPLGGASDDANVYTADYQRAMGPTLKDIAPPTIPMWAKVLGVMALLGVILTIASISGRRR